MSDHNTFTVTAVIPSYNGRLLLAKHLPAVFDCLRNGDELVIVDDHSSDDTVEWFVKAYQLLDKANTHSHAFKLLSGQYVKGSKRIDLTLVINLSNVRFGEAVNRGVLVARGDLILLLNNDVKPTAGLLDALLPHFAQKNVFGVGCLEEEQQGEDHRVQGGKNKLWFERGMFIHSRADNFSSGETAWVSGGSGLFHRAKWLELNGFDSSYYPAYWEDIDLSFRAKQRGWKVFFEEKAIVEHHHETTNSDVFGQQKIAAMSWKNAQTFVWKNGTLAQKLLHLLWKPYWWWKRYQTVLSS